MGNINFTFDNIIFKENKTGIYNLATYEMRDKKDNLISNELVEFINSGDLEAKIKAISGCESISIAKIHYNYIFKNYKNKHHLYSNYENYIHLSLVCNKICRKI